jgi:putative membrane protein
MKLLLQWFIISAALVAAAYVVPGIRVEGNGATAVLVMAVILGLVNVFIRPVLAFLSCGFIILTMGLFMLVVNALSLWLASSIAVNWFNVGFYVDGFWPAFWGSIIVSIVSFLLSVFLKPGGD